MGRSSWNSSKWAEHGQLLMKSSQWEQPRQNMSRSLINLLFRAHKPRAVARHREMFAVTSVLFIFPTAWSAVRQRTAELLGSCIQATAWKSCRQCTRELLRSAWNCLAVYLGSAQQRVCGIGLEGIGVTSCLLCQKLVNDVQLFVSCCWISLLSSVCSG